MASGTGTPSISQKTSASLNWDAQAERSASLVKLFSIPEHSLLMTGKKTAVPAGTVQLRLGVAVTKLPPRNQTFPVCPVPHGAVSNSGCCSTGIENAHWFHCCAHSPYECPNGCELGGSSGGAAIESAFATTKLREEPASSVEPQETRATARTSPKVSPIFANDFDITDSPFATSALLGFPCSSHTITSSPWDMCSSFRPLRNAAGPFIDYGHSSTSRIRAAAAIRVSSDSRCDNVAEIANIRGSERHRCSWVASAIVRVHGAGHVRRQ